MRSRGRKISTSIQLTANQFDVLDKIIELEKDKTSNSTVLREAFELYVKTNYPQFVKYLGV